MLGLVSGCEGRGREREGENLSTMCPKVRFSFSCSGAGGGGKVSKSTFLFGKEGKTKSQLPATSETSKQSEKIRIKFSVTIYVVTFCTFYCSVTYLAGGID